MSATANKRYQVFISATFPDMQGARQALMLPMLEHGLIPTGLDSAAADGNTLLPVIQKLIETSDYFILIVGGRYGTLPEAQREPTRDGQVRRDDFVRLLEEKVTCYRWSTEAGLNELAAKVIPHLMREHHAVGWVRADQAGEGFGAQAEGLKARIELLEKEREEALSQARPPYAGRGSSDPPPKIGGGDEKPEQSFKVPPVRDIQLHTSATGTTLDSR